MLERVKHFLQRLRGPMLPLVQRGSLACCLECGAGVVNPVDWHEHDDRHWWVLLRCGECGRTRRVIISDAEAHALERDLQPGIREIYRAAEQLERERMREEAETFVAALERDLIDADDFAAH
jgi:hypothetical protein